MDSEDRIRDASIAEPEKRRRVSIDTTVVRDLLDERREHHGDAKSLFALADEGKLEVTIAPQGHRDDVWEGDLQSSIGELIASGRVAESEQMSRVSCVTYLPFLVGHYVEGFDEAWDAVLADWKTHQGSPPGAKDRWHTETHILDAAEVFLTDDRPLLVMCQRLRDEHGLPIEAMRVSEYLRIPNCAAL